MTLPRIGVTGMRSSIVHGLRFDGCAAASAVLRCVVRSGAEPLVLFGESASPPAARVGGFDGLLVPGGFDVDPRRYGERPLSTTVPADFPEQDQFEADLMAAAIERGVPVLAICRGFQLLNVELGGSLTQDLPPDSVHRNGAHDVTLTQGSRIAAVIGEPAVAVSSYHHQAVRKVGAGLRVVGRSPDGVVEALEHERAQLIAVQWHPEDTAARDPRQQALFDWLARCAGERRT